MKTYSQNNEQDVILAYYKDKPSGTFLDIGAFDGKTFSNTYALAELGWAGYMVEPSSFAFSGLLTNMMDYPHVVLINSAITPDKDGLTKFHDSMGDALTTSNPTHLEKWSGVRFREFLTNTISIDSFIQMFDCSKIDFISLDTESTNWDMLQALMKRIESFPNLTMVCVEYDSYMTEITELMTAKGFMKIHQNGENLIFVRQ